MDSIDREPGCTELYLSAIKLRGIAHLLECKGEPASPPENIAEINWGIGLVLEDVAGNLKKIASEMEETTDNLRCLKNSSLECRSR